MLVNVVTSSIVVALTIVSSAISSVVLVARLCYQRCRGFVVVAPARIGTRRGLIDDVRKERHGDD